MALVVADESKRWKNLRAGMQNLQDELRCWTCNKVFKEPVSYRCGHFFCCDCAKEAGTKCPSCNVPSLASEIQSDRIISAVVGCFQTLSTIVNGEREDLSATRLDNTSNISSSSIVYDKDVRVGKKASAKSKPAPVRRSVADKEVDSDKVVFVKPSRVRKSSIKDGQKLIAPVSIRGEDSSINESREKNSSLVALESKATSKKSGAPINKRSSADSSKADSRIKSGCSDENFPQDSFTTPKKPRRGNNKTSNDIASNSTAKEINTVKSTPRKNNTPGRELIKRNHKGETPLHVACIKGDVSRVQSLLEANASPNTKDNAGWTPLHEAVNHGYTEVVELLVNAGAFLDAPGAGNITPLHEAVSNNFIPIAQLLIAHGADLYARSSEGQTPMDLATSDELKEVLLSSKKGVECKADVSTPKPSVAQEEMVLCGGSGLTSEEKKQLSSIAVTLDVRIAPAFGPDVTHLIVHTDANGCCPPSMEILCAIMKGVSILNQDWLEVRQTADAIDEELFEIAGVADFEDANAPKLSRLNAQKQLPGLFNGCHFFVHGNAHYKLPSFKLDRLNLITLIKTGGGIVLKRQPDPEAIPESEQKVPYHAPRNGELTSTSHFILYSPGKGEPEMKYNMKHCKTLTVEWFINCILNWQLIDP